MRLEFTTYFRTDL